jgi:L-lactate dehydrogenase complex protein LldE
MKKIGLFIPCYVNQFFPNVAVSTLQLLENLGCVVHYPVRQTCCGQPMANSGYSHLTGGCDDLFVELFSEFDHIVCPSGSCVLHIKQHLKSERHEAAAAHIRSRVYELTEFLTDILNVQSLPAVFPHRVGVHQSCHGQRGLHLAQMSELVEPAFSKVEKVLQMVSGLELVPLQRKDECCGFGGTFCVFEEAVSVKMGRDRVEDHLQCGVEFITGTDVSCLMHLDGIIRREKREIQICHIAEILNKH